MRLAISIIETNNHECPMVGTIRGDNEKQLEKLLIRALEAHFDAKVVDVKYDWEGGLLDLKYKPAQSATVTLDVGHNIYYDLTMVQTWIYE